MQTDTLPAVDELEDIALVCEVATGIVIGGVVLTKHPCPEPVKWIGNRPCCGRIALVCDEHSSRRLPWFCLDCQLSHNSPTNWRPL